MSETYYRGNANYYECPILNDYETEVFDRVSSALINIMPDGNVRSEYVPEPESFPLVTLIRMDSIPDWNRQSSGNAEDMTIDTYEMHVYALSMDECKAIASVIAEVMRRMNFRRLNMGPLLNGNDIRIAQIVGRFEHRIDKRGYMYR